MNLQQRSIDVIAQHQADNGAYPASPTFSVYGFSWLRDGAFIADGMSRSGVRESADRFFDWCAATINSRREQITDLISRHASGDDIGADEHPPTRYTLDGHDSGEEWWDFQLDGYGTWMWALGAHAERHRIVELDPAMVGAIISCVDYLTEFWAEPCFDWWEEHRDDIHTSTLASIAAGLRAVTQLASIPATTVDRAALTADAVVAFIHDRCVVDGSLIKMIGDDRVDASLIAAFEPFRVLDPTSELADRTYDRINTELAPDGVHRYLGDTFFGGGRWVVLAGFVGLFEAQTGRVESAQRRLEWIEQQRTVEGLLPEQTTDHVLDDTYIDYWVNKWGTVATPLLWSHAMHLSLVAALGEHEQRPLIEHHPLGSGHPYRIDPDQRHPVDVVDGDASEIRVVCDPTVEHVDLEIVDGAGTRTVAMAAADFDAIYPVASSADGHLAAASGSRPDIGDRHVRAATVGFTGTSARYRFLTDGFESDWFHLAPGTWKPATDVLSGSGAELAQEIEVLDTAEGPTRVRFAIELDGADRVVGFGERFDHVDQRGQQLDTTIFEQYKDQGNRTYLPSPFAMMLGERNRAVHIDTSRRVWFDVGATTADRLIVETTLDSGSPDLRVHAYSGSPSEMLAAHLGQIGASLVRPPDWIFRPWMSGNEWNTQERVLAEVERSLELDLPVGVMVIEAWSDESTFVAFNDAEYEPKPDGSPHRLSDFTFPADGKWPDPKGMVDRLHDLDVKVMLWQIPIVPTDRGSDGQVAHDAATLIERGYCIQEEDGSPYRNRGWWFPGGLLPDWTNPETIEWWIDKRRYLIDELGIDGFKTDGGEHAWGDDLRYHNGKRGVEENNLFANRYAGAYHQLIQQTGIDGTTFSRAGFTGAGAVPCHWAGDENSTWEAFRASITAGLSAGLSGVPFWGWDIAGFSGEIPSVELFARSVAMGAFCPIMQYHSEFNHGRLPNRDRTPWNLAERHRDDAPIEVYRRYAHLRDALVPYLSAEADHTVASGTPMMRPIWFDDPADSAAWKHPYQYRFGRSMVVAPVCWEGRSQLDVHLPDGEWIDATTGATVTGGTTVTASTPLMTIPVYVDANRPDLAELIGEMVAGA